MTPEAELVPDGFKMTELGPLPEEWQVVRLGEVAIIEQGKTPKREEYNDKQGHRIVKVKDFEDGGEVSAVPLGERSFVKITTTTHLRRVYAGDALILNAGHSPTVVGQKVGRVPKELDGCFFVGELTAIRAIKEILSFLLPIASGNPGECRKSC